jgi:hypothetical protein
MAFMVKSRRATAMSKSMFGSVSTTKPRWPSPVLLSWGEGDVEVLPIEGSVEHSDRLADFIELAGQCFPDLFLGEPVHLDVDVHGVHSSAVGAGEQFVRRRTC